MKKKQLIRLVSLCVATCLVACGCTGAGGNTNAYEYKKQSEDNLYFYSSDERLDKFLNDFYERHSRRDALTAINDMQLGTAGTAWKAWESLSLVWFDSTGANFRQDSFSLIKKWLYSAPVDDYGYAWSSSASLEGTEENPGSNTFGMGWPFPNYGGANYYDWEFNGYNNDEGWKVSGDGSVTSELSDGMYKTNVSGSSVVSFEKDLTGETIDTISAPFLEFDIRWCLDGTFTENNVDDIYVGWKNTKSDEWHEVKVSDCVARSTDLTAVYSQHLYMPMYLLEDWGTDNTITALKISVRADGGATLSGELNMNYVRANYDSRQIDNGYNFLEAAKLYYEYTGDEEVLRDTLTQCRKIVMFMIYNLQGKEGLVDLSNFEGHDGGTISDGVEHSIASSYWDILSLSPKSLYAQVLYHESLKDLIYLENAAEQIGLELEMPTIRLFSSGTQTYDLTVGDLHELMKKVEEAVQQPVDEKNKTGFWDSKKGRFIEGFNMHGDVVDYGSTIFNNMVVAAGMATSKQGKQVVEWINGDRDIKGDMASGHTGDEEEPEDYGIYDYVFAPRTHTIKNTEQYTTGHASGATRPYSYSCQDGGAILFTSYYDIMARMNAKGVEDAYERLGDIKDWYLKVYDFSAEDYGATQFYRSYYLNEGITLQGGGTEGTLGLDTEFLENAILYAVVPMGFFNIESKVANTLSVSPNLPKELEFWRMENLMFQEVKYDLEIGKNYVVLESVRGATEDMKLTVNLETKKNNPKVYSNGMILDKSCYEVKDGVVSVTVDFVAQKIVVK